MTFRKSVFCAALKVAAAGVVLASTSGSVSAFDTAQVIQLGKMEYMAQCASCHGESGRGDGPVASVLQTKPLDLTKISSRYSGQYPADHIYQIIDGQNMISPHGDRAMPVWGYRYFAAAVQEAQAIPHFVDAQALAHGRITSLVSFLESIQSN